MILREGREGKRFWCESFCLPPGLPPGRIFLRQRTLAEDFTPYQRATGGGTP